MPNLQVNAAYYQILNGIFYRRMLNSNRNIIAIMIGKTGSGKSWSCISIAEAWYTKQLKRDFPAENICFSIDEIIQRLRSGQLKRGDLLILEEGGVNMGSLDFQSKIAKAFNYVLQSFRSLNVGLLINLPYFSMLNKSTRMLAHIRVECLGVDPNTKTTVLKPLLLDYNQITGNEYVHYPKFLAGRRYMKAERLQYPKPSELMVSKYEKRKFDFVNKTINNVALEHEKGKKPTESEVQCFYLRKILGLSNKESAQFMGVIEPTISKAYGKALEKGLTPENIKNYAYLLGKVADLPLKVVSEPSVTRFSVEDEKLIPIKEIPL